MKDKEIELKFIINKEIKNAILSENVENFTKVSTSRVVDTYYIPYYREFEINGETMECVRIRENEKGFTLTYKKIHRECDPVYCDEYETKIEDKDQMEKLLFALGFSIQMKIDKTRESYKMNGLEFDFDTIENLGEHLEIEIKDESLTTNDIYNFVAKYGLTKDDVTYKGIQVLMKEALNKKSTQ